MTSGGNNPRPEIPRTKFRAIYTVTFILPAKLSGPLPLLPADGRGRPPAPTPDTAPSGYSLYLEAGLTLSQYTGTKNMLRAVPNSHLLLSVDVRERFLPVKRETACSL